MITNIKINGFKSFQDFEMEFTPLTVIAGENGTGKTNLFDAIKLLSRLAETDNLKKACKEQRGEFIELFTQYAKNDYATQIQFCVEMSVKKGVKDAWGNQTALNYTHLTYEIHLQRFTNSIGIEDVKVTYEQLTTPQNEEIFFIKTTKSAIDETTITAQEKDTKIDFKINTATRTVLSSFDRADYPHIFAAKEEMKSWKRLQLNPHDLRQPTSKENGTDVLSTTGKNLAALIHRLKHEDKYNLTCLEGRLGKFVRYFVEVIPIDDKEKKQFSIELRDNNKNFYSLDALSDGTLRVLALSALEQDSKYIGALCFEEPENGIYPEHIKDLVELLKEISDGFVDGSENDLIQQIIVSTYSPVFVGEILNYIIKDDGKKSVSINLFLNSFLVRDVDNDTRRVAIKRTNVQSLFSGKTNKNKLASSVDAKNFRKRFSYTLNEYMDTTNFGNLKDKIEKIKENNINYSITY